MNITIVSDFNTDPFVNLLGTYISNSNIINMPYGQVYQNLINICNNNSEPKIDFLILWTRAEAIFPEYNKSVNFKDVNLGTLNEEFDSFYSIMKKCSKNVKNILILTWTKPIQNYLHGLIDYNQNYGSQYLVNYLNNSLADATKTDSNIYMLNTSDVMMRCQNQISNNQMKYLIKMPYSLDYLKEISSEVFSCINGLLGKARRVLVLDLDNTLWGGILGDDGIDGINIGGHDTTGEAFLDFQEAVKTLKNKGVALAIASKNYEQNALEAIEKNEEMYLKKEDFSAWRINWDDKAANIVEIAEELNLGLSSIVFIDDNPSERARVSETLPDVLVPEWPESPTDYKQALLSLNCFNVPLISEEDKVRVKMFAAERDRKQLKDNLSHEDWLKSIGIKLEIESISNSNKNRVVQLLNKSNQFNAISRRFSGIEIEEWRNSSSRYCWAFRVSDKYGESGLTAVITFELKYEAIQIYDFVMSCRVMGRSIENLILKTVINFAVSRGIAEVRIDYKETERNQPIKDFLVNRSGFTEDHNSFTWNTEEKYSDYLYIELIDKTSGDSID